MIREKHSIKTEVTNITWVNSTRASNFKGWASDRLQNWLRQLLKIC